LLENQIDSSAYFAILLDVGEASATRPSQFNPPKSMNISQRHLNHSIALSFGIAAVAMMQTQGAILIGGSNTAWDNASAYAYDDGWQSGDNGGYGWGAWTLTTSGSNSGHFIGSSTANADGIDDGIVGGLIGDWDIDTTTGPIPDQSGSPDPNSTSHRSWGMYANSGEQANAYRDFLGGSMAVGQTFSMDFDNSNLLTGVVGLGLQNAAGVTLWEVYFAGGNANYFNNDASGANATLISYGDEGINVTFELTGSNAYTATLTRRDGINQTISGNLIGNADQAIHHLRAFNFNAGSGTPNNAYFNIVPEPTSAVLGLLGTALLLRRRRL
jgi:hypothetical protein